MDAHQGYGGVGDGCFVIGAIGAVGGANLPESRAALGHNVRNAKSTTNFNELAARDYDFPAGSDGAEAEENCRGVVVDRYRGLCTGETAKQFFNVGISAAPPPGFDVEFQV